MTTGRNQNRCVLRRSPIVLFFHFLGIEIGLLVLFFLLAFVCRIIEIQTFLGVNIDLVFFFIIQLIALSILFWLVICWFSEKYQILEKEIIIRRGIFFIQRDVYQMSNIELIKLRKNICGILFGYGTIHMYAPTLNQEVHLFSIHNPQKFMSIIEKNIAKKDEQTLRKKSYIFPAGTGHESLV